MASSSSNVSPGLVSSTVMTSLMQDRQARNKPFSGPGEEEDSDLPKSRNLSFEMVERRRKAATVLDSPELLMTYANALGDSIPSTRQRMTKILCGYEDSTTEDLWGGIRVSKVPKAPSFPKRMSRSARRNGTTGTSTEY